MGLRSTLSASSVVGGSAIVVGRAEESLRMIQSLRMSEDAAEASYKVNVEALNQQCVTVDDRLEEEEKKVEPVKNALEHYRGQLEAIQDAMDQMRSKINEAYKARSAIPTYGETDAESKANQAAQENLSNEIQELEKSLGEMDEEAGKLNRHIEEVEECQRKVEANIESLTNAHTQVHREKENYETEGAAALARLKDDAAQRERELQAAYAAASDKISSR